MEREAQIQKYPRLLRSRLFLYLTGFFSGMSVMAIELGASRMLAPYFSSSQIVWTVIIGTIMIAMAIGNVWGGRASDKDPDPRHLYFRLLLAAIWCALIPFVGKYLIAGVTLLLALFVTHNFLLYASFLSCIVLFVFPLLLLGTVTPALMKFATNSLESNGKIVGELEAVGTIGSIIGTFLPTFVTIPTVGTDKTFLIFAAVLALICLAFYLSVGIMRLRAVISSAVILLLLAIPFPFRFAFWESGLLYEGESIYNYLQVKETEDSVVLSTNVAFGVQSIAKKGDATLTGYYYDTAMAAPYMAKERESLLILGLGSGTYATLCRSFLPELRITGVEIDEKIVMLAKRYFGLPNDVCAVVDDGRAYLAASSERYDVIMVDAYQDITIPFQMSSVEFFTEVSRHLSDGGVMVVNMNMRSGSEGSINDYLIDTICSVFPYVYTVPVDGNTNVELFATHDGAALTRLSNAAAVSEEHTLRSLLSSVCRKAVPAEGGELILTDDRAPVELLGMRVLDEMISKELSSVRSLIRKEGIFAALEALGG